MRVLLITLTLISFIYLKTLCQYVELYLQLAQWFLSLAVYKTLELFGWVDQLLQNSCSPNSKHLCSGDSL